MEWSYEALGVSTYLVYQLEPHEIIDNTVLGMLTNNEIPGLAKVVYSQIDSMKFVKYNITARISLSAVLEKEIAKSRLLGIFASITSTMSSIADYMIDISEILLDSNSVFVDVKTNEVMLICLPLTNHECSSGDLKGFLKGILVNSKFKMDGDIDYISRLLNHLNSENTFSLRSFQEIIAKMQNENTVNKLPGTKQTASPPQIIIEQQPQPSQPVVSTMYNLENEVNKVPPTIKKVPVPDKKVPDVEVENRISLFYLLQHYNEKNAQIYREQKNKDKGSGNAKKQQAPKKEKSSKKRAAGEIYSSGFTVPGRAGSDLLVQPEHASDDRQFAHSIPAAKSTDAGSAYKPDFGDTVPLEDEYEDDGTVIMDHDNEPSANRPQLMRKANGERIIIDHSPYNIGREKDIVDYQITGNRFVGHVHCQIVSRNGICYITDNNTKNHTYIDGIQIKPGREEKLVHGQILKLADEEFIYSTY